ncbi:class I adenylate cyclase [bacterium]|nr:class I adenylate cyclase [bacterium]
MEKSQSGMSAIERQLIGKLGIDRDSLASIKDQFLAINDQRLKRAGSLLSERQAQLLRSLPSLLDCNHPMLPGYVSRNTPAGIQDFTPDEDTLGFIRTLAKSFRYTSLQPERQDILGLFLMGSIGTIAHSENSDIDIWVCIEPSLTADQVAELKLKCEAIEQWAQDYHLEIHFFLMDWQQHLNKQVTPMDEESAGSTQYYLLLDEFYRTAIALAGCLPIWLFVKDTDDKAYEVGKKTIQEKGFLAKTQLIDLGNVSRIPPQEFLTAAIWQLYKAIESPYKSILKLLLLEAYAAGGEQATLSSQFKHKLHDIARLKSPIHLDALDPYLQAYYLIEHYLTARQQPERLELVRRCLYLKVNKRLSRPSTNPSKSWQRECLEELVRHWGWSDDIIIELDRRDEWKTPEVNRERKRLIDEMNRSYQLIVGFWKQHDENLDGNNKDLNLLGRKLQAAFGQKSGKIDIVNPGIARDITESKLFFVLDANERIKPWSVFRQTGEHTRERIVAKKSLSESIAWCFYNAIIGASTRCYSDDVPPGAINDIIRLLKHHMPSHAGHEKGQFEKKPNIQTMLFIVHTDPEQEALLHTVTKLGGEFNALEFGGHTNPLITQIDCIYTNQWHEVYCQSFASNAIVQMLILFLRSLRDNPTLTQFIHCFNSHYRQSIEHQLHRLTDALTPYCLQHNDTQRCRMIVNIQGVHQTIEFNNHRPIIRAHEDNDQLIDYMGQPSQHFIQTYIDRTTLNNHPLKKFVKHNTENTLQIFFEQIRQRAFIYVFDEKGTFVRDTIRPFSYPQSLQQLHRFLRTTTAQYVIDQGPMAITPIQFFELHQKNGHYEYRESDIDSTVDTDNVITLSAICEVLDDELTFTVTLNDKDFPEDRHGHECFQPLALEIEHERGRRGPLPFAILSLDLSNCQYYLSESGQLYASHYLHVKRLLESKINLALEAHQQ